MTLIALGINHKTASVELREKVAFSPDAMVEALCSLRETTQAKGSMIVSTCNRTELYLQADTLSAEDVLRWLAQFHGVDEHALRQNSYIYTQEQAVQHVMRVACGLDSLVLGEPQILGQVKQAYSFAKNLGLVESDFERLIQQTFAVAKRVRSETDIGANAVSVAYASVQLAKHIFSSLEKSRVLLIGAGETIELVARHLREQDVKSITVANRTLARAEDLAEQIDANVITLAQIPTHLHEADIVISSTASQLPILGKGMVERALKERRYKPMFLVDLAVPRDIEGEVGELDDAYLYTVDDLQQIVEQNIASRNSAAQEAEKMVAEQAHAFMQWREAQQSVDLLREFRQQSEQTRDKLLARAVNQLAEGKDPQQLLVEMANKLTNALLHPPTRALKMAAESDDKGAQELLRNAFGLDMNNGR